MRKSIYFDLDGTLCEEDPNLDWKNHSINELKEIYKDMKPKPEMIKLLNEIAAVPKTTVVIWTARDDYYEEVTLDWLKRHGVKGSYCIMKKPYYHLYIDNNCVNCETHTIDELRNIIKEAMNK